MNKNWERLNTAPNYRKLAHRNTMLSDFFEAIVLWCERVDKRDLILMKLIDTIEELLRMKSYNSFYTLYYAVTLHL